MPSRHENCFLETASQSRSILWGKIAGRRTVSQVGAGRGVDLARRKARRGDAGAIRAGDRATTRGAFDPFDTTDTTDSLRLSGGTVRSVEIRPVRSPSCRAGTPPRRRPCRSTPPPRTPIHDPTFPCLAAPVARAGTRPRAHGRRRAAGRPTRQRPGNLRPRSGRSDSAQFRPRRRAGVRSPLATRSDTPGRRGSARNRGGTPSPGYRNYKEIRSSCRTRLGRSSTPRTRPRVRIFSNRTSPPSSRRITAPSTRRTVLRGHRVAMSTPACAWDDLTIGATTPIRPGRGSGRVGEPVRHGGDGRLRLRPRSHSLGDSNRLQLQSRRIGRWCDASRACAWWVCAGRIRGCLVRSCGLRRSRLRSDRLWRRDVRTGNVRGGLCFRPVRVSLRAGFHRHSDHAHYRFPYYSYRRPWYHPGHASYNRDTNYPW